MKALSLTQPWASLVAVEAKRIETRSWRTSYRGRLAIHASKGFPPDARMLCGQPPFSIALLDHGLCYSDLPLGAVVAVCRLVNCLRTEDLNPSLFGVGEGFEREFGDYTPGRFAWVLSDVQRLADPIPARGSLGLWDWPVSMNRRTEVEAP